MKYGVRGPFRPGILFGLIVLHAGAVYGTWSLWHFHTPISLELWLAALAYYAIRGLGITVGYHRYWTHNSFECAPWVQCILAGAGAIALEGPLAIPPERQQAAGSVGWVGDHRQHHAYTEHEGDPHSPWRYPQPLGFLWAHIGWLLWQTNPPAGYRKPNYLSLNPIIRGQYRLYWPIAIGLGFVLPLAAWGLPGLWLCGFIGVVVFHHVTWAVNSVAHLWGTRPRDSRGRFFNQDQSRNNVLVALLGFGEGWHGNHHRQPNSAELGYRWYQYDPGKWLIYLLKFCRQASDVNTFKPVM
jgi:stearoyl-CoA desaturase (Delta-9 desaturase)